MFQRYSKVIYTHIYVCVCVCVCVYFFSFLSLIGYYNISNIVPCSTQ